MTQVRKEKRERLALIGLGRWGRKLLRVLNAQSEVVLCCNKSDHGAHSWLKENFPHIRGTFDYGEILGVQNINAVVIATPIETHAPLARLALEGGKHVFVEKPLATTISDAEDLVELATERECVLFVGNVFLFHPVLEQVRTLTEDDPVIYAKMEWTKCGTFEENIFWNLACHEISIALELFRERPVRTSVVHQRGIVTPCDVIMVHLEFDAGRDCFFEINRCSPPKSKSVILTTKAGRKFVWQDDVLHEIESEEEQKHIYSRNVEALAIEVDAFLHAVQRGVATYSNGAFGCEVVSIVSQLMDKKEAA